MNREAKILSRIDKTGWGVEIGPSHSPIVPKCAGYNVHVIDYMTKSQLIEKFKEHKVQFENIEEVDYVWTGGSYLSLTKKPKFYDWVIASHVIEHTPDLIGFLQDCDSILKDDGVLSLAIPDGRDCFDHFRPITGISKIIDCAPAEEHDPQPRHRRGVLPERGLQGRNHRLGCSSRGRLCVHPFLSRGASGHPECWSARRLLGRPRLVLYAPLLPLTAARPVLPRLLTVPRSRLLPHRGLRVFHLAGHETGKAPPSVACSCCSKSNPSGPRNDRLSSNAGEPVSLPSRVSDRPSPRRHRVPADARTPYHARRTVRVMPRISSPTAHRTTFFTHRRRSCSCVSVEPARAVVPPRRRSDRRRAGRTTANVDWGGGVETTA